MAEAQQFNIDPDDLTIDEMELAEDVTGVSFDEILSGKARTSKVLRAFALIHARRTNPAATLEQVGKMTASELSELLGAGPLESLPAESSALKDSGASRKPRASRSAT